MKRTTAIIVGCAVALVGVVALSWIVGRVGPRREFNWELASVFGTALGTTLLALATGSLALLTSRDVSATQELAALTRQDQLMRDRPLVIGAVTGYHRSSWQVSLEIELRNVGLGPAVLLDVSASYEGPDPAPSISTKTLTAVGPGARELAMIDVTFSEESGIPGSVSGESFVPTGTYQTRTLGQDAQEVIATVLGKSRAWES